MIVSTRRIAVVLDDVVAVTDAEGIGVRPIGSHQRVVAAATVEDVLAPCEALHEIIAAPAAGDRQQFFDVRDRHERAVHEAEALDALADIAELPLDAQRVGTTLDRDQEVRSDGREADVVAGDARPEQDGVVASPPSVLAVVDDVVAVPCVEAVGVAIA